MPRRGRLHSPGGYYHVMGRGSERRKIFSGIMDKEDFLFRLGEGLEQTHIQCLAWALMSNHYHLLLRVSDQPLSKLMSRLLSGYATQYNIRKRRSGYVFQNRYKSILCNEDEYLLELVRYIHLNPLKVKIVRTLSELDRYRWTGHSGILGRHVQQWQSIKDVLRLFGRQSKSAKARYREFVKAGITSNKGMDLSGGGLVRSYGGWEAIANLRKEHTARIGDERILGDSDFVEKSLKQDRLQLDQKTYWIQKGWDLEKLIKRVCDYFEVDSSQLQMKGRANNLSTAKGIICYWGTQKLGISSTEFVNILKISQPAISKASKRGYEYCEQEGLEMEDLF